MTLEDLKDTVVQDLSIELNKDQDFDASVLEQKVEHAIREIISTRKYPSSYTEEMIENDVSHFYSNVYNIALYDYNQIGVDFQTNHSENGVSRAYMERAKLFYGVIPLTVM